MAGSLNLAIGKDTWSPKAPIRAQTLSITFVSQWLSQTIPHLAEAKSAFTSIAHSHNMSKEELKHLNLEINWTDELNQAWQKFLDILAWSSKQNLARNNCRKEHIIVADASQHHWAAAVLQVVPMNDNEHPDIESLSAEPLFFVSGTFDRAQSNWHKGQKEMYPIIHVLKNYQHVVWEYDRTLNIFTDHRALQKNLQPKKLQ